MNFEQWLHTFARRIEGKLEELLPSAELNEVCAAIRYSCLGGGKRLRPAIVYSVAEALNVTNGSWVDSIAAAIEVTHAYSLIHDDLPAMDDDDSRHNQPSCHVQYNEATAILAGDAMQALSFDILYQVADVSQANTNIGEPAMPNDLCLSLCKELSNASGSQGMIAGQLLDLQLEAYNTTSSATVDIATLEYMHRQKTGQLFAAAHSMVYLASGGSKDTELYKLLHDYALTFGLAFQIHDDILDCTATTEQLGKPADSDSTANKITFVSVLGLEEAKRQRTLAYERALSLLRLIKDQTGPKYEWLRCQQLLDYAVARVY